MIGAEMGQKVKMFKVLLDYLTYQDLNKNMIYTVFNREIGFFNDEYHLKIHIQAI